MGIASIGPVLSKIARPRMAEPLGAQHVNGPSLKWRRLEPSHNERPRACVILRYYLQSERRIATRPACKVGELQVTRRRRLGPNFMS